MVTQIFISSDDLTSESSLTLLREAFEGLEKQGRYDEMLVVKRMVERKDAR